MGGTFDERIMATCRKNDENKDGMIGLVRNTSELET